MRKILLFFLNNYLLLSLYIDFDGLFYMIYVFEIFVNAYLNKIEFLFHYY